MSDETYSSWLHEIGCCFPGECCMAYTDHFRHECYTPEMAESEDCEYPISKRLRDAANGKPYQLHWLCEAADEIDKFGLTLMMIAEGAPDNWSRKIAAKRLGREFKPVPQSSGDR